MRLDYILDAWGGRVCCTNAARRVLMSTLLLNLSMLGDFRGEHDYDCQLCDVLRLAHGPSVVQLHMHLLC